jgi:hypothetical protein
MKPTIGRVVHYYKANGEGPFCAFVVAVHKDETVDLIVFVPRPPFSDPAMVWCPRIGRYIEDIESRKFPAWAWPPREEDE